MLGAIHPQSQQAINEMIQDPQGNLSTYPFPDNIAADMPVTLRKEILTWMEKNYIWPQIQMRKTYERQWDKLLNMVRASWRLEGKDYGFDENDTRIKRRKKQARVLDEADADSTISEKIDISDTIIFDAVDRLTNLNHFISFKEDLPVRYEIPDDMVFPHENEVYSPMSDFVKAANSWLKFIASNQNVYREGWKAARHHYTYGISFVNSEFVQKIEQVPRRVANKQFQNKLELTDIGVTFEPISIRKLWLNPKLPVYKMRYQACPFFFEEMPRFAVVANQYNPQINPFGFVNTENLPKAQYLFGAPELEATFKVWSTEAGGTNISFTSLMPPELDIELLWTFYAMLPLGIDPQAANENNPKGFVFDHDGSQGIPQARWIVQTFGNNLCNGQQEIIRLQRNFYPKDDIPLYGSSHIPTLDDGAYGQAIGTVLENHYIQICKSIMQYLENKDWVNDPAHTVVQMSPAMNFDLNKKGAKIPVLSQNDIQARPAVDATQTTPQFLSLVREQAQTSSKAVDAILGKAMGSRTSATEASNAFQTAMSGVTTDINLFSYDIYGGYATRVWDYTGRWVDPDILSAITGSYGFAIKPEHMALRLGLKWDTGSSFIESVTRQNNYRYLLESTQPGDPAINRAYLYKELLKEWKVKNVDRIINDGGLENQVQLATEQACSTYLGQLVLVDPDQDHNLAIKVKKSFLADRRSIWNTTPEYVINGPKLVDQIKQHYLFLQMQMLQQQVQMQQMMLRGGGPSGPDPTQLLQPLQNGNGNAEGPGQMPTTAGQQRQQTGQ